MSRLRCSRNLQTHATCLNLCSLEAVRSGYMRVIQPYHVLHEAKFVFAVKPLRLTRLSACRKNKIATLTRYGNRSARRRGRLGGIPARSHFRKSGWALSSDQVPSVPTTCVNTALSSGPIPGNLGITGRWLMRPVVERLAGAWTRAYRDR